MEQQIVVKSEINSDEQILLFYVDENGGNEESVLTTVEGIKHHTPIVQEQHIYLEQADIQTLDESQIYTAVEEEHQQVEVLPEEHWDDADVRRLLIFFIDNKEAFVSGVTKKSVLWSVACKTILLGKSAAACEIQLFQLKQRYTQVLQEQKEGVTLITWDYFELAHQAFNDDPEVLAALEAPHTVEIQQPEVQNTVFLKKQNRNFDPKIELMLRLYLKYKNKTRNIQKDYWQKGLWETIAHEMGETDSEYWNKRFLNFKQHYLRLLDKRKATGSEEVTWPYFNLFEAIYRDDKDFQKKFNCYHNSKPVTTVVVDNRKLRWNDTERMVLVKYNFDSLSEFQDPTIPDKFLWSEIGRILDKEPDSCKTTYELLKDCHLEKYLQGDYDMKNRLPLAILFDNLISREAQYEIANFKVRKAESWTNDETDLLVHFIHNNVEVFKDPMGYYVCWVVISKKVQKSVPACLKQFNDLKKLYKSILEDKKENPDNQIDWRYIDLFDRIFDYGMDGALLIGYEQKLKPDSTLGFLAGPDETLDGDAEDLEMFDDVVADKDYVAKGYKPRSKREGDPKVFKILQFYMTHRVEFQTKRQGDLWEELSKEISLSAQQCAHRFRNLKQVYKQYVQRENNQPNIPIVWPYYQFCKKVFGFRRNKKAMDNDGGDSDIVEEWSSSNIKALIKFVANNFSLISENPDPSVFTDLAPVVKKTILACRNKFVELRKSYRKLKTMKRRNSAVKVTWRYFPMFDAMYSNSQDALQNIEELLEFDENKLLDGDEAYECIIVLPEGSDISELPSMNPSAQNGTKQTKKMTRWNKKSKKQLLIQYLKYLKAHKGEVLNGKEMWTEIASKMRFKTPMSCKKQYAVLKGMRQDVAKNSDNRPEEFTAYYDLIDKITALKPKFQKNNKGQDNSAEKVFKDFQLADDTVRKSLELYLQNVDEFVNPRFEKKYAWTDLANNVNESLNKVFNKVNLLKQMYRKGEEVPFKDLVKEITEKEDSIRSKLAKVTDGNSDDTILWSDDEKEQLLQWYLTNLDKFKNPKFVRKYLWLEVSNILNKSALSCSKTMSEIRTQYRTLVRETPDELNNWRFYELCQKIYGTGKPKT